MLYLNFLFQNKFGLARVEKHDGKAIYYRDYLWSCVLNFVMRYTLLHAVAALKY